MSSLAPKNASITEPLRHVAYILIAHRIEVLVASAVGFMLKWNLPAVIIVAFSILTFLASRWHATKQSEGESAPPHQPDGQSTQTKVIEQFGLGRPRDWVPNLIVVGILMALVVTYRNPAALPAISRVVNDLFDTTEAHAVLPDDSGPKRFGTSQGSGRSSATRSGRSFPLQGRIQIEQGRIEAEKHKPIRIGLFGISHGQGLAGLIAIFAKDVPPDIWLLRLKTGQSDSKEDRGIAGYVALSQRAVVEHDLGAVVGLSEFYYKVFSGEMSDRSMIAIPVLRLSQSGKLFCAGVYVVSSTEPNVFTNDDVAQANAMVTKLIADRESLPDDIELPELDEAA